MKIFKIISNRIDSRLKKICDSLSPVQKMCLSVTLFTIFFLAALYIMVMAAYQVGKSDGKLIQIEHIQPTTYIVKPNKSQNE
ncbi:TraL conjugative transposon family protein [Butyricimonas sp.]|uniref:TraL conjugative transposon family protein n=1 Tax=Butyricimonas sp. TaxID=1969738 RepID=UPI0034566647